MSQIEVKNVFEDKLKIPCQNFAINQDYIVDEKDVLPRLRIHPRDKKQTNLDEYPQETCQSTIKKATSKSPTSPDSKWTSPRGNKRQKLYNSDSYNKLKSVINARVFEKLSPQTQCRLTSLLPQEEIVSSHFEGFVKDVKDSVGKLQSSSLSNVFLNKAIHDFDIESIRSVIFSPITSPLSSLKSSPEEETASKSPTKKTRNKKRLFQDSPNATPTGFKKRNTTVVEDEPVHSPVQARQDEQPLAEVNSNTMPPPPQTKILSAMREKMRAKRLQKDAERGRSGDNSSTPNSACGNSPTDLNFFNQVSSTPIMNLENDSKNLKEDNAKDIGHEDITATTNAAPPPKATVSEKIETIMKKVNRQSVDLDETASSTNSNIIAKIEEVAACVARGEGDPSSFSMFDQKLKDLNDSSETNNLIASCIEESGILDLFNDNTLNQQFDARLDQDMQNSDQGQQNNQTSQLNSTQMNKNKSSCSCQSSNNNLSQSVITSDIDSVVQFISNAGNNPNSSKTIVIDRSQLSHALSLLQSINPNVKVAQQNGQTQNLLLMHKGQNGQSNGLPSHGSNGENCVVSVMNRVSNFNNSVTTTMSQQDTTQSTQQQQQQQGSNFNSKQTTSTNGATNVITATMNTNGKLPIYPNNSIKRTLPNQLPAHLFNGNKLIIHPNQQSQHGLIHDHSISQQIINNTQMIRQNTYLSKGQLLPQMIGTPLSLHNQHPYQMVMLPPPTNSHHQPQQHHHHPPQQQQAMTITLPQSNRQHPALLQQLHAMPSSATHPNLITIPAMHAKNLANQTFSNDLLLPANMSLSSVSNGNAHNTTLSNTNSTPSQYYSILP